jgi:hypothetical protein
MAPQVFHALRIKSSNVLTALPFQERFYTLDGNGASLIADPPIPQDDHKIPDCYFLESDQDASEATWAILKTAPRKSLYFTAAHKVDPTKIVLVGMGPKTDLCIPEDSTLESTEDPAKNPAEYEFLGFYNILKKKAKTQAAGRASLIFLDKIRKALALETPPAKEPAKKRKAPEVPDQCTESFGTLFRYREVTAEAADCVLYHGVYFVRPIVGAVGRGHFEDTVALDLTHGTLRVADKTYALTATAPKPEAAAPTTED